MDHGFITGFKLLAGRYNDLQPTVHKMLHQEFLLTLLQNAVRDIPTLRNVQNQDSLRYVTGGTRLTYAQYMELLKSVAITMDATTRERRTPRRSINNHTHDSPEEPSQDEIVDDIIVCLVNQMERTRSFTPRMNKDTWTSLSKQAQVAWDTLADEDKGKILGYVAKNLKKRDERSANITDLHTPPTDPEPTTEPEPEPEISSDPAPADDTLLINKLLTQAQKDTHPADVRRAFSKRASSLKKTPRKPKLTTMNVHWQAAEHNVPSGGNNTHPVQQDPDEPAHHHMHDKR